MPHATMTGPRSLSDLEGYTPDFCQGFVESLDQCEGTDCESCTSNSECTWFAELGVNGKLCAVLEQLFVLPRPPLARNALAAMH